MIVLKLYNTRGRSRNRGYIRKTKPVYIKLYRRVS